MSNPNTDELPPLIFRCRWLYSPGKWCSQHITPPERLCEKHKVEDKARLIALKEAKTND